MQHLLLITSLIAIILISVIEGQLSNSGDNCCEEYCYAKDEQPYIFFGSKTAYESISSQRTGQQHVVPNCQPVQFWSINRHGTRYPDVQKMHHLMDLSKLQNEIVKNYRERKSYPDRGKLCPEDFHLLARWRWNETVTEQRARGLSMQGVEELKYLARRYRSKFPQILQEPYSEQAYFFQYTNEDRTHDSYKAFIDGLFGPDAYKVHANVQLDNDFPTDQSCPNWQRNVGYNFNTFDDYHRFTETNQEFLQMNRDVARRLGFKFSLNATIIQDIYDLCRYEKAWNVDQKSAWCSAFNTNQLKLFEYADDLQSYYKYGYGNEMNRKLGCPLVKDLFDKFQRTVNDNPTFNINPVRPDFNDYSGRNPNYNNPDYNRDYDRNRDNFNTNRDYDRNRDNYDRNRDNLDRNRDNYDLNRDNYDRNRDFDRNRDYDRNRDNFDRNRDNYDLNRDNYDRNRDLNPNDRNRDYDRNRDDRDRYFDDRTRPDYDRNRDYSTERNRDYNNRDNYDRNRDFNDRNRDYNYNTNNDQRNQPNYQFASSGYNGNRASFYFGHSQTILSALTALDFFRDDQPLTADNFYQQTKRQWRTSKLDPFASNLAAVLYQCTQGERYRVMFFLNEMPIEIPECSVGLCNWSTFQQKYENLANNCNIQDFCNGNGASSYFIPKATFTNYLLLLITVLTVSLLSK